ncbi:MAG: hypothetical protein KJ907_08350 [Actinobacteria bacterium]|nr:hypothetical protein [Planctomycetota bacterium]MBU4402728.1 hypothetical protein [Actinomycetota bacterium]
MRRVVSVVALATLVLVPIHGGAATAQGGFNMTVFPAKFEIAVAPGASADFAINVRNDGAEDQNLRVYFMDYYIKPNNQFVFKEPEHYAYSCGTWLSTDTPELYAPAGKVSKKGFRVTVPGDAEPGGHYAVIFFEGQPPPGSQTLKARPRIGSLALVTVPGEIVREGEVKSVRVGSAWFWPKRKFLFFPTTTEKYRVAFYNKGNVHLTIKGKLTYSPTFGWGSGSLDLGEITVLPKTTRYLEGVLPKPPAFGSYRVKAEVQYGPSLDVFDTTKTKTASFNVYPLSLLLFLILLIAFVIFLIKLAMFLLKRRRKQPEEAAEEEPAGEPEAATEGELLTEEEEGEGPSEEESPGGAPSKPSGESGGSPSEGPPKEGKLSRIFRRRAQRGKDGSGENPKDEGGSEAGSR